MSKLSTPSCSCFRISSAIRPMYSTKLLKVDIKNAYAIGRSILLNEDRQRIYPSLMTRVKESSHRCDEEV